MRRCLVYLTLFLSVLAVEVFIALYVHDSFVRPYLGDVLVVVVIYFFLRIFIPDQCSWLPGAIFLGSTFDGKDILCYGVGCAALAIYEWLSVRNNKFNDKL